MYHLTSILRANLAGVEGKTSMGIYTRGLMSCEIPFVLLDGRLFKYKKTGTTLSDGE